MRYFLMILVALVALLSPLAHADIVTMKDGSTVEGTITKETRNAVTIETKVSNIKTAKTISKRKVAEITYQPLPDGFWDSKRPKKPDPAPEPELTQEPEDADEQDTTEETTKEAPQERTKRPARASKTLFVVVPIHGGIGTEVNTYGLRQALKNASKQRIEHIVFTIDSPGGYVYQAVEMMEILKDFDNALTYHAVIEEGAISAASIFAACSDDIFVRPGSRLGGAVSFSKNSTGNAQVDAKMNSIWAAEIASRADAKGHPGEMFRAMVVLDAELFQASDGTLSASASAGSTKIDSTSTILTIRAAQLVKAGVAKEITGDLDTLGELLGIDDWTERKNIGTKAMSQAGVTVVKLEERLEKANKYYDDAFEKLEQNDPMTHRDYRIFKNFDRARLWTYAFDGESTTRWRERTDTSVRACNDMLVALKELASVNAKAKKYGARHLLISANSGDEAYKTTSRKLSQLKQYRNKPPYTTLLE